MIQRCGRCQDSYVKYCTTNKKSNVMYVRGVQSCSIYTIRDVMLCMSKGIKALSIKHQQQWQGPIGMHLPLPLPLDTLGVFTKEDQNGLA